MFLKLSSNIVRKLSPNIVIYRLVGTELNGYIKPIFSAWQFILMRQKGDYVALLANLCFIWEKMEIWKRNTWYGNLFWAIFFIYEGIRDNTPREEIRVQSKPLKRYQNVKTSIATSHQKHNRNI